MIKEKIKKLASDYSREFIEVRHHLHQYPELSYKEFETSKFIQQKLKLWNIPFKLLAQTGIVGLIEGKNPGKKVTALRADMDALPITEENEIDYVSRKPGVMHACGHDVHSTCLLGAAKILNELKGEWEGTVKLIFQPGEERNPGGASIMIKEGVLENPVPQSIFALHVHPALETGKLSFRSGKVMASADEIFITIKGKGGHAASPHLTSDTILIASHLIVSLQQLISRNNNPFNPSVLSITSFQGGYTTNVIPSEVKLMGTFRAMNEEWRFRAHELIKKQATELVNGMGAEIEILIDEILRHWNEYIAVSFLPKSSNAYPLMPYEKINKTEYLRRLSSVNATNIKEELNLLESGEQLDDVLDASCATGICPVR